MFDLERSPNCMYDKEDEFKMPSKIIIQNSADFQKKNKVKSTSVQRVQMYREYRCTKSTNNVRLYYLRPLRMVVHFVLDSSRIIWRLLEFSNFQLRLDTRNFSLFSCTGGSVPLALCQQGPGGISVEFMNLRCWGWAGVYKRAGGVKDEPVLTNEPKVLRMSLCFPTSRWC